MQVLRRVHHGIAEFTTISYWSTPDEIRAYAGQDIEKPHHLQRDPDYLLELPREVKHYDVLASEMGSVPISGAVAGAR